MKHFKGEDNKVITSMTDSSQQNMQKAMNYLFNCNVIKMNSVKF